MASPRSDNSTDSEMTTELHVTVVTSCTGDKATDSTEQLQLADFQDGNRMKARERELAALARPAGLMYTGDQHRLVMVGVDALRERFGAGAVTLWIVSAGYGLVSEDRMIVPYNVTFKTMGRRAAREWAQRRTIPQSVRTAIARRPLTVVLLGEDYLRAVEPPVEPSPGERVVFVAKPALKEQLGAPRVTVVPVAKQDARRYHAGYVALKGRMFELWAKGLARKGPKLWQQVCDDSTPVSFMAAVEIGLAGD
jgi:hypothetical protein